jgi:phage portal protein BeeE
MALYDVCYILKLDPEDSEGVPMGLWPIPPQIITPRVIDTYMLTPPTSYIVGRTVIDAEHIIPIRRGPLPGIPDYLSGLLQMARAEFAGAIAQANYTSRYWQSGGPPTTVLETDANLSDPQATALGNRWAQRRSQGPDHPAILSNGLKAHEYGADPTTQAAVEAGRDQVAAVARYFGVHARMVNAPSIDSQTYKTSQEENLDLVHYTLQNYIGAIEDAITDLLPGNRTMTMISSVLTEGTQLARAQAWQLALGGGGNTPWMTPEEVREKEGLPPQEAVTELPDDAKPLIPANPTPSQAVVSATVGGPR